MFAFVELGDHIEAGVDGTVIVFVGLDLRNAFLYLGHILGASHGFLDKLVLLSEAFALSLSLQEDSLQTCQHARVRLRTFVDGGVLYLQLQVVLGQLLKFVLAG